MRGSMNYSHEMDSEQVRNTFRTLQKATVAENIKKLKDRGELNAVHSDAVS